MMPKTIHIVKPTKHGNMLGYSSYFYLMNEDDERLGDSMESVGVVSEITARYQYNPNFSPGRYRTAMIEGSDRTFAVFGDWSAKEIV